MVDPHQSPAVRVERRGHAALLRIERPASRNALTPALLAELERAALALVPDRELRAVVVTGAGDVFAAGADLRQIARSTATENLAYNRAIVAAFEAVAALPVPTIAAINGHALGGGLELALACTLRVAAEGARLGLPEVRLGLVPGAGGTWRLPRLVPRGVAWRMLLTGASLTAAEAHGAGLVDEVAPAPQVLERALALAEEIAAAAPLAVRAALRLGSDGRGRPAADPFDDAQLALRPLLESADLHEGIDAFLSRRRPTFTGT